MCNDYTVFNTKLLDEILQREESCFEKSERNLALRKARGREVDSTSFQILRFVYTRRGGAEFVHAGGLTGRFTWIFGFKIQKKNQKTPPRSSLQFCSLFLCRKPNVGIIWIWICWLLE